MTRKQSLVAVEPRVRAHPLDKEAAAAALRVLEEHPASALFRVSLAETITRLRGSATRTHEHADEYQIELIVANAGTFVLDGQTTRFSGNALLLIPPGVSHSFLTSGSSAARHFTVRFRLGCPQLPLLPSIPACAIHTAICQRVRDQIRAIIEDARLRPLGYEQAIALRIASIYLDVLRTLSDGDGGEGTAGALADACRYMALHMGEPLSVSGVAEQCGLRTDSLCRLFRKRLRTTPSRYLLDLRIRHGQALLRSGYTVTECADRCGFASIHYFSRAFRAQTGVCPSRWLLTTPSV